MKAFARSLWVYLKTGFRSVGAVLRQCWQALPPLMRTALRNIIGVCLMLAGLIMALPFAPGPGIPTIIAGFLLLDFPRKRAAVRWLQHSWLIQKLLAYGAFAHFWRHFRRQAKNSENKITNARTR